MNRIKVPFSFAGLSYTYFRWFGIRMPNVLKNFDKTLEAANIRIHPETYLSMMGLVAGKVSGERVSAGFIRFHFGNNIFDLCIQ